MSSERKTFRRRRNTTIPFRFIGGPTYKVMRPARNGASVSLWCNTLPLEDIPFEVQLDDAMEYARDEHNVYTSPALW